MNSKQNIAWTSDINPVNVQIEKIQIQSTHCDIVMLSSGCIRELEITHNECQQICWHRNWLLEMRFNSSIWQSLLLNHWHVWECFVIFVMNNHSGKCCFHCRLIKTRKSFTCICWFKLCCSKTSEDKKKYVLVILVYMCCHMNNALTMLVSAQQGNNTKF